MLIQFSMAQIFAQIFAPEVHSLRDVLLFSDTRNRFNYVVNNVQREIFFILVFFQNVDSDS